MKTILTFLILSLFTVSCSIKPICNINNNWVVVIDYTPSVNIFQFKDLNCSCLGTFRTYDECYIGDTVRVQKITFGDIASGRPAEVKILQVK